MEDPVTYISDEEGRQQLPNSQQSEDCSNEHHEEGPMEKTINDADIMENTQAVLERPATAVQKKKKIINKGKGIGKANVLKQKRTIQTMSFFIWLKNYWDNDSTMQIMGRFVTAIKKHALQTQQVSLGKLVRPLNQIMKTFILDMSKQGLSLKRISWDAFESWALDQGLSTMYSNCHTMVWEKDFEEQLFKIYGQVYLEWSAEKQQDSSDEEEEQCSLRNITTTSMSSMTARTAEDLVDVDLCGTSKSTQLKKKTVTFNRNKSGHSSTNPSILKSKTNATKSTSVSAKRPRKPSTSEEDTDEETIVLPPKTKKTRVNNSEDSESDPEDSGNLNDMLDAAVQAQCLLQNTGSISQNMSLKHLDSVVTLKSRGERGTKVVKLEVYPFKDCLRKERQEWWKYAEMRSLFLEYSDDSRVSMLLQKLTKEVFKQIKDTKKVEIKSAVYKRT